LLLLDG
jgi:hypothetical protein